MDFIVFDGKDINLVKKILNARQELVDDLEKKRVRLEGELAEINETIADHKAGIESLEGYIKDKEGK